MKICKWHNTICFSDFQNDIYNLSSYGKMKLPNNYIALERVNILRRRICRRHEMSKELVKGLIDLVPDKDIETIYQFIIKFIPEDEPMEDEIIAIKEAKEDTSSTISHKAID